MINKIYNEDCLKTLSRIKNNSVDLIITSPPYNMNLRIKYGKYIKRNTGDKLTTKYTEFTDDLSIEEYNTFHSKILKELLRVGDLIFYNIQIITGNKRSVFKMIGDFKNNLKDIIIWDKQNPPPAIQEKVLNRRTELILIFEKNSPISRQFKNKAKFLRGTLDDLWTIKPEYNKLYRKHLATFPQELVKKILINFSNKGDLIYDPFIGLGTTAIVAKKMDRKFLGSEINTSYYNIAYKRLMTI